MSDPVIAKKPFDPDKAPKAALHVEARLDSDLDVFTHGLAHLPTTINAVNLAVKDAENKDVVGRFFVSVNQRSQSLSVVYAPAGAKRMWSVDLNNLIRCMCEADAKYMKARDPEIVPAKKRVPVVKTNRREIKKAAKREMKKAVKRLRR